ncbi:MAG: hypothetical protein RJA36_1584 [Pseudomonadota bacterium]|jgi:GH24 family phage-related lysozyme (muramidase)
MAVNPRIAIAALALSAAALVKIASEEGYTETAVVPVKGDRPTVGFGSTFKEDGSPVQMGDRITPPAALGRTLAHIQKDEAGLRKCVTGALNQGEYDILVNFTYQYGPQAACASSIVKQVNAGNYEAACDAYLLYRFVGRGADRYDCSTTIDGKPNRRCWGVWERSRERQKACRAAAGLPPSLGARG